MLRLILFFCLAVAVSATSTHSTSSLSVPFCSGTPMFRQHSHFAWTPSPSSPTSSSSVRFSFCTPQKRALASVNHARLRVKDVDVIFNLCTSPMDCIEKSTTRNAAGLYCLQGHEAMEFPVFASPKADTDLTIEVLNSAGHELAVFCKRY
jgi:hypothetical protein